MQILTENDNVKPIEYIEKNLPNYIEV